MTYSEHFAEINVNERRQIVARGVRLEYVTVSWNILEGAVAIVAGLLAGSVALLGFGVDSANESCSGKSLTV